MTNERVILYPDPEQKVENLWFEIGHFLGFQNVEGYRIIPSTDGSPQALLLAAYGPPALVSVFKVSNSMPRPRCC